MTDPTTSRFGLSCAIVTPVTPDGAVDLPRFAAHARRVVDEGCDTITLHGTTGEGASLGWRARERMLGAAVAAGIAPGRFYAGVFANATEDAVDQGRAALEAGLRGLLVAPPSYFKGIGDDALFAWYARLIEGLGPRARGILVYNLPSVTAVPIPIPLVGRLREAFPGVILGVKDSSSDWPYTEALLAEHRDLAILVGDERLLARAVRGGAQGSICGLANLWPGLMRPLVDHGTESPAVTALVDAIVARPVLAAIKALVARQYRDPAFAAVLPPLTALDPAEAERLGAECDAILARAGAQPASGTPS